MELLSRRTSCTSQRASPRAGKPSASTRNVARPTKRDLGGRPILGQVAPPDQVIAKLAEGDRMPRRWYQRREGCSQPRRPARPPGIDSKSTYGGMKANDAKRLKELEAKGPKAQDHRRRLDTRQTHVEGVGWGFQPWTAELRADWKSWEWFAWIIASERIVRELLMCQCRVRALLG